MPVKKTFYVDIIIHIHMHAFLVNSERKSQDFPKEASLHLLSATLNLAKQKVCMEKLWNLRTRLHTKPVLN